MKCPKCSGSLEETGYAGIRVDRCKSCDGIWFDFAELQELLDMEGAVAIDTGSPVLGEAYNEVGHVICPSCEVPMVHVTDQKQRHVHYEICAKCHGVFLDAGEFSDLKEFTTKEWLSHLKVELFGS